MGRLGRLLLTVIIFAAILGVYSKYRVHTGRPSSVASAPKAQGLDTQIDTRESQHLPFHCDGRTYCSQMTSCAEAKYFLAHCPGVTMDGDHDGIPCETQWCPGG